MKALIKRTVSGIVFLAVMSLGIIWSRESFGALFMFVTYFSVKELYSMALGRRFVIQQYLGLLASLVFFGTVASWRLYGVIPHLLVWGLLLLLLIPVSCIFFREREGFSDLGVIYAGLLYICFPACLLTLLVMDGPVYDGYLLLAFFIIIWASDVGAYCLGSLLGQRPGAWRLAPEISPKKSWWGVLGGVLLSVAAAFLLCHLTWIPFGYLHGVALALVLSLGGVCGDLFESEWKRHFGVKDSGKVIPGHGGMLDRFDSSFVGLPLAVVYLLIFSLI